MIDKLKFLIDECENKPKLKALLLKVAELPENKQEATLLIMENLLNTLRKQND